MLHNADLNLINLETAATTQATKWPDKVPKIQYAGLANNHTLDFSKPGLLETVKTIKQAGIGFAGAGESRAEATRPAFLRLPAEDGERDLEVHIWAASDQPTDWARVANFHLIDYSQATRQRLEALLTTSSSQAALKVFSVPWGPNYSWRPSLEIRDLAHFPVDECGIDVVHDHSSHHVQGVERYNGSLIIYGCGDFFDDYALVEDLRNDLSGVWQVHVKRLSGASDDTRLQLDRLEMFPTKIDRFQVKRLTIAQRNAGWVAEKIRGLSGEMGTKVEVQDQDGALRLLVNLS